MSYVTPEMGLIVPGVSTELGPEWASLLNACLDAIDLHTHQTGSGVPITPAAININAALNMATFALTNVDSVQLEDLSSDIASRGLFAKNGELQYRDTAGNIVAITASGSVAGANGSITNLSSPAAATYSSVTKQFIWTFDSSSLARMANADISLFPYDGTTAFTKSIAIKAPTTLEAASSYSLTLPAAVPPSVEFLSMSSAGVIDHASLSGTSNQVAVSASATAITLSLPSTVATSVFSAGDGAAGTPAYTFTADPDTGIYRKGTNNIGFATAGALVAEMTSTGSLSLGASNPATFNLLVNNQSATGSGIYSYANNSLSSQYTLFLEAATGQRFSVRNDGLISFGAISTPLGSMAASGAWTFGASNGSQSHRINGNALEFSSSGSSTTNVMQFMQAGSVRGGMGAEGSSGKIITGAATNSFSIFGGSQPINFSANNGGSVQGQLATSGAWTLGASGGTEAHAVNGSLSTTTSISSGTSIAVGTSLSATTSVSFGTVALGAAGSVGAPAYSFTGDTNTGIYSSGADTLDFATAGTRRMSIDLNGRVGIGDGSLASPALTFLSDTDTGVYRIGSNSLSVVVGGSDYINASLTSTAVTLGAQLRAVQGSAATPGIGFVGDTDTGFFRSASDDIGIACGGSAVGVWSSSRLNISTPVSMSGAGGSAVAHKTSIFTGTTAAGGTVDIDIGATVYGVFAYVEVTSGTWGSPADSGSSGKFRWANIATANHVGLFNDTAGTRTYRITVFHA